MPARRLSPSREAELRAAEFTYPHVGSTSGLFPTGYRTIQRDRELPGTAFVAVADALMSWRIHRRAGLQVQASGDVSPGAVVELHLGLGPATLRAPCRVVYTVDEPDRRGFAYGTLPGHPETGEEAFTVRRHPDGHVTFTIRAFSRPASALTRLAGPVGHWLQDVITDRYLRASGG